MMWPSKEQVEMVRKQYPAGCRVELVQMDDPYTKLRPGCQGTVTFVDDAASIHVKWDIGSSLAAVYGEDIVRRLDTND